MREKILLLVAFLFLVPAFAEVEELPSGDYVGLSTDTKPTSGVDVSDLFTEVDTQRRFVWSGSAWVLVTEAIGGSSVTITTTPTLDTGAYSDNDVLGGKIEISGAARVPGGSGIVQDWIFIDTDSQASNWQVYVFDEDPSSGTYTDNSALTLDGSDVESLIDQFAVDGTDWKTEGGVSVAVVNRTKAFQSASSSRSLFVVILVDGSTPTHTATGLKVITSVFQD